VPRKVFIGLWLTALALAACNAPSSDPGGDIPEPPVIPGDYDDTLHSVPKSEQSFRLPAGATRDSAVARWSGDHAVGIYATPPGKDSRIGPGRLRIALIESQVVVTLTDRDRDTLVHLSQPLFAWEVQVSLQSNVLSVYGYPKPSLETRFGAASSGGYIDGVIAGKVTSSEGVYRFRNEMLYYGLAPPPQLKEMAAAWARYAPPQDCAAHDTLRVSTTGMMLVPGCGGEGRSAAWDGQDDFVTRPLHIQEYYNRVNFDESLYFTDTAVGGAILIFTPGQTGDLLELRVDRATFHTGYNAYRSIDIGAPVGQGGPTR
jgi:hypothetical protein